MIWVLILVLYKVEVINVTHSRTSLIECSLYILMLFDLTHSLSIRSSYGLKSVTGQCQSCKVTGSAASVYVSFRHTLLKCRETFNHSLSKLIEFKHAEIIYCFLLFLTHFLFQRQWVQNAVLPSFLGELAGPPGKNPSTANSSECVNTVFCVYYIVCLCIC